MKIGICTITDGANYGNRLQNYALQEVLKSNGYKVETFRRKTTRNLSIYGYIKRIFKNIIKFLIGRPHDLLFFIRCHYFKNFNDKYINFSTIVLKNNNAPSNINELFDYFISGSDQIWNTNFDVIYEDIDNYLLSFADPQKRISYAASIGTTYIDEKYAEKFKKEIGLYKKVMVREKSAEELLRNQLGIDAFTVLDPTMLLSSEEWKKISCKPKYVNDGEKFVVTYFMSGRNEMIKEHIEEIAKKNNAKIINLDVEFIDSKKIENIDHYLTNPNEFLWLIENSCCVLTDSFHATVFSIIFNKPFLVYERQATEKNNNMGTRIDNLLNLVNLDFQKDDMNYPVKYPENYDDKKTNAIIREASEKSLKLLTDALN